MNKQKLEQIKNQFIKQVEFRKQQANQDYDYDIMICGGTGCRSCKSYSVQQEFEKVIKQKNLSDKIKVHGMGCFGLCAYGPIVMIYPDNVLYEKVKTSDCEQIVDSLIKGETVENLLHIENNQPIKNKNDITFFKKQLNIARNNSAYMSLENMLGDYIALEGYKALHDVITCLSPEKVIDILKQSGLRGRGGAGFLTGAKWQFAKDITAKQKYVVCNADEGDPGAFMDRSILESNPHSIIEAMAICGFAIGSNQGYVYLRAEYPLAGERLQSAIDEAYKNGLLGKNIFETDFCFDLQIKYGAGAFVCGEETALIKSVEGYRGEPNLKPPYPAVKGLYDCPTIINNVETLANVAQIINKGADWFKNIGTKTSAGTKVFALTGKINNSGLVELPMGTTINEIVYEIGGGIKNNREFKAVQMGGPSGGCIPSQYADTPIDYESLKQLDSMMGSGGMIVMDEDTCMVDIARFFLEFSVGESCGKCTSCRIGNKQLLDILTKICDGRGTMEDLDQLENLSKYICQNSLCGLGQTSPNPVLSTLKYFKDEYIQHINGFCRAGVCKNLVKYEIDKTKCIGCSLCSRICPVRAISGEIKKVYEIDPKVCIKCGKCMASCRFNAIKRS